MLQTSFRILTLAAFVVMFTSCASRLPNRNPTGETFPSVQGESLKGESVEIPEAFAGQPVILILGYVQDAQFDADRWLLGFLQSETRVAIREVPTIEGLMAGLFAGTIDNGMRKGIPSEDWGSVITVYDEADTIVAMTGSQNPRNVRVLLLDRNGKIVWFHDRGYSAGKLMELKTLAESL